MKKIKLLLVLIAFLLLCINVFAQNNSLNVKISGHGNKSIIFIPGFACSGEVWNETVKNLESEYKCYVLTMPGFAGIKAEENPTIKSWVNSVTKYIEQEKIKNPIIVGHSLGGIMAQWLAADYPTLVSKIIVVDALPCLPSLSNPTFKANDNPDCSMFVNAYDNMNDQQFYQMQKRMMLSMVADTSKVESIVNWGVKSDRSTMAQIYCQLLNTDLREKISTVTCPSLILLEPVFKQMDTTIAQQYQNLKGAKLEYGTNGLHFIMYDNKDWYFQQLKSFLN